MESRIFIIILFIGILFVSACTSDSVPEQMLPDDQDTNVSEDLESESQIPVVPNSKDEINEEIKNGSMQDSNRQETKIDEPLSADEQKSPPEQIVEEESVDEPSIKYPVKTFLEPTQPEKMPYVTELYTFSEPDSVVASSTRMPQILRVRCDRPDSNVGLSYPSGGGVTLFPNGEGTNYFIKDAGTYRVSCVSGDDRIYWEYTVPFDPKEFTIDFLNATSNNQWSTLVRCSASGGFGSKTYEYLIDGKIVNKTEFTRKSYAGSQLTCRVIDAQGNKVESTVIVQGVEPKDVATRSVNIIPTSYGIICDADERPISWAISIVDDTTGYSSSLPYGELHPRIFEFSKLPPIINAPDVTCTAKYKEGSISVTRKVTYVGDASLLIYPDTKEKYPHLFD